jgi:glyoxylase I family protein
MIHGIDHTAISVPDLGAAVAFYCDVLGFEVESESGWPIGAKRVDHLVGLADSSSTVAMVRMGETRIEIFQYATPEPALQNLDFRVCDHGITHFCLAVTEIEKEYARLIEAGVEFNHAPLDVGTSICVYGRDPFGNVFEMKEHKAPE